MKTSNLASIHHRPLGRTALLLGAFFCGGIAVGRADTAAVVTAANTLLTTSTAQTSPYALVAGTSILPAVTYTTSGSTVSLVYSLYTVSNLGSVTWTVEISTDLSTWTTAVNGTSGVTVATTAYSSTSNYTVVTVPNSGGGSLFARFRATLPGTYTGTVSGTSSNGNTTTAR